MKVLWLLIVFCLSPFSCADESFYVVSHSSYASNTYNTNGFRTVGSWDGSTHQCRRTCLDDSSCKAFIMTLIRGTLSHGLFHCVLHSQNACDWSSIHLKPSVSLYQNIWEKLNAEAFKPKPCIENCAVRFKGNCQACRGFTNLFGIDCDIAPRLCSDYPPMAPGAWPLLPLWPWGFYGRKIVVHCEEQHTGFLTNNGNTDGTRSLRALGWDEYRIATTVNDLNRLGAEIDWELISMLVDLSKQKLLVVVVSMGYGLEVHKFSGFSISPYGELSLNSPLSSSRPAAFLPPILKTPFVKGGSTCGPFWQFQANVSVCTQRTNLLLYANQMILDNQYSLLLSSASYVTMTFI